VYWANLTIFLLSVLTAILQWLVANGQLALL
jgi:hypothetical protein